MGPGTSRSTPAGPGCLDSEEVHHHVLGIRSLYRLAAQQIIRVCRDYDADFTSEIRVSADGNFVYRANRLNTPSAFSRSATMAASLKQAPLHSGTTRIFAVDPQFMAVCNQFADNVTTRCEPGNSSLKFTGNYPWGSSGMVFDLSHCS
jgi:6-phosphogluconolactonase (cycloisomerase 2 family)